MKERLEDLRYTVKRITSDAWWWLMHRVHPSHRYNVLHTGLKPGYYDPNDQILHACMNAMKHFVEGTEETIDRENDLNKEKWDDLLEIYNWWVNVRPTRDEFRPEYPDLSSLGCEFSIICGHEHDHLPVVQEWRRAAEKENELENIWYKEDEGMLMRLIKLRPLLWYP